jgi:hypothetical protein
VATETVVVIAAVLVTGPRFAHNFNFPFAYDYIAKVRTQQAEVMQNHENEHVRGLGQGGARHRNYKRLKLGGGQAYDRSRD